MRTVDRLVVNIQHLDEAAEVVRGELSPTVLELADVNRIECPQPVAYDLRVSQVSGGLLVEGQVEVPLRCRCDRCLAYYDLRLEDRQVCHFIENVAEDLVDITDEIREDLLITLPQKLLCRQDCQGLCPACGRNLNYGSCECGEAESAPGVWDQLNGLSL